MINVKSGFSLIELMVVVAIVALIAAIAAPSYYNYIIGARMSTLVPITDKLLDDIIDYSQRNGYFPNAEQMDLPGGGSGIAANNPQALNPYLTLLHAFDNSNDRTYLPSNCGASGYLVYLLDVQKLGFPSNVSNLLLECDVYHINGALIRQCYYYIFTTDGGSLPGNFLPGWYNSNLTTNNDCAHCGVYNSPLQLQVTCQ